MPEVQDVLFQYGSEYKAIHKITYTQEKVMNALMKCRTAQLGGHTTVCSDCGSMQISYNSCRNRHCPKCQTLEKEKWIAKQKNYLLNVPYFHIVMTIPDTLHGIFQQNQNVTYNLLFKAVSQTIKELAENPKYLGGQAGFTAILHTWGQNLMYHPHIHCVVPGGVLNKSGMWIPSKKNFFLPVKTLSRKFRGKLLALLKEVFYQGELTFHGSIESLEISNEFERFLTSIYQKEWVVYCKPPFKTATSVLEYLGRYTHRIAISNNRILNIKDGMVTFRWRDYKDNGKWKNMTITAEEFIRRFLMHILPTGFMKIRHYGFLGNRNKATNIRTCKWLTKTPLIELTIPSPLELIEKLFGKKAFRCPCCNSDKLIRLALENT